ncbi:MAG: tetratricopeptide repeat protein [bacterium]
MQAWLSFKPVFNIRLLKIIYISLPILFFILLIINAWECDDAYITFRTVDNFVNGYGLRWNVIERVQTYTNPLWMLVVSIMYYFTREIYYTSIILSIIVSLFAVLLFYFKLCDSYKSAILGLIVLSCSKAFIDFTTSGLENPLLYLLLVGFFYQYYKSALNLKTFFILSLCIGLSVTTRMDSILLFFPAVLYCLWQLRSKKSILVFLLGFTPFIFWEIFAIWYYGFPFPNTAYAKLFLGFSEIEKMVQGVYYFTNSFTHDPITLVIIGLAIGFTWFSFRSQKDYRYFFHACGIILYLLYILLIGGDFMSGRFFAVPFLSAIILFVIIKPKILPYQETAKLIFALLALIFSLFWPYSPILSGIQYHKSNANLIDRHGIADERNFYYSGTGLLCNICNQHVDIYNLINLGKQIREKKVKVYVYGSIGFVGYYAGPQTIIVDQNALSDSLLAHLPPHKTISYRIGHFCRVIPLGYYGTLLTGKNMIQDKNLAVYYDRLCIITRGTLFSSSRLKTIWDFNTGKYNYLIDFYYYRNAPTIEHLIKGINYKRHNQILDAEQEFKLAINLNPDNAMAHDRLARIYFSRKQYPAAEAEFRTALKLNPYLVVAYNNLGKLYLALGRYQEATSQFEQAVHLDPLRTEFQHNLALAKNPKQRS